MEDSKTIEIQQKELAPYAVKSSETLGRKYLEQEHPLRTPFQRDRDRIIHSTAFRRLEYKTQVFIYHEGDYYRNRLTHTLEVQQIARTIARVLRLNEDLVEAIALAHDLGHTPFGHRGEAVLNNLMRKHGYNRGFEHNRQGLRIVDKLEKKYPHFPGLNLSFETREGIIKHNTTYDLPAEEKDYEEFIKNPSPSLESQVVDFADEIAYTCHDLDDGLKSGIITFNDLKTIQLWKDIESSSYVENVSHDLKRIVIIRNLINFLVEDMVTQSLSNIKKAAVCSVDEVRKQSPILSHSPELKEKHTQMSNFLQEHMYANYRIIRMAQKAARVIEDLFDSYIKEPKQLPPHTQEKITKEPIEIIVCDYIAGMTDRFALLEYRKLFDPNFTV